MYYNRRKYKAGIPSWKMNQVYMHQQKEFWCWSASISMILNAYGLNFNQYEIAQNICGINVFGFAKNCPASPFQISKSINITGHFEYNRNFTITAPLRYGQPDIIQLITELINNRPVMVAYYNTDGRSSHAIILTGCEYEKDSSYVYLTKLIVRDPANNTFNKMVNGRREIENVTYFLDQIHSYWYIKVFKSPSGYQMAG